jgi:hypothetical protein
MNPIPWTVDRQDSPSRLLNLLEGISLHVGRESDALLGKVLLLNVLVLDDADRGGGRLHNSTCLDKFLQEREVGGKWGGEDVCQWGGKQRTGQGQKSRNPRRKKRR